MAGGRTGCGNDCSAELLASGYFLARLSDSQAEHLREARAAATAFFNESPRADKQLCRFLPEQLGYSAIDDRSGTKEQFLVCGPVAAGAAGGASAPLGAGCPFPWPDHPECFERSALALWQDLHGLGLGLLRQLQPLFPAGAADGLLADGSASDSALFIRCFTPAPLLAAGGTAAATLDEAARHRDGAASQEELPQLLKAHTDSGLLTLLPLPPPGLQVLDRATHTWVDVDVAAVGGGDVDGGGGCEGSNLLLVFA
eukprot:SAG22_NODE_5749_length_960_cov_1.169570_1_plen_255_part_10